jgi:hypothetical protein
VIGTPRGVPIQSRLAALSGRCDVTERANTQIVEIDRVEIAVEPWSWPFAIDRREEIDRHFVHLQSERSAVWNGRSLVLNRYAIQSGVLRGTCFETDYASLCALRDWNFPDVNVYNFYAAAALRAADGGYLLGEMASYTAGAGCLLFGTPEPDDIGAFGVLDLNGNLGRELLEETGINIEECDAEPGWSVVRDRGFLAMFKRLNVSLNSAELRSRMLDHIASNPRPEFTDVRIVREPGDLSPRLPLTFATFLEREWRQ